MISPQEKEKKFERFIIKEYLRYGSVDEVFRKNNYDLPISYPGVHRLINRWGIVKAAGPNSKLSEALTLLVLLSDKKLPLERLYKVLPPSFKTSLATMHRIMHNVKEGIIRRYGTALVIVPEDNPTQILVGDDISTPRLEYCKPFGSTSLPVTFSKKTENPKESILRVIQHEVFTQEAIEKKIPAGIIPDNLKPFMYLDIADVRVAVYQIKLPSNLSGKKCFSSFKLINHRFLSLSNLTDGNLLKFNFRAGAREVGLAYKRYLNNLKENKATEPLILKSLVNLQLADFALEFAR